MAKMKVLFRNISTTLLRHYEKKRTYYDILGVQNDCSPKELKAAYIQLSKIHHPDVSMSQSQDKKAEDEEFKKILEAYTCLSRSHSRTNYDNSLKGIHTVNFVSEDIVHRPFDSGNRYSSVNDDNNYYGVKGVKKVANWKIVMACVIFCAFGILLQIIAITKSMTFKRDTLSERSNLFSKIHTDVRNEVSNSNAENLERILGRMKRES